MLKSIQKELIREGKENRKKRILGNWFIFFQREMNSAISCAIIHTMLDK